MDFATFRFVYSLCKDRLQRQDTHLRYSINPEKRFPILLNWLTYSLTPQQLANKCRLGCPTLQEIIHHGVWILCSVFVPHSIRFPTGEELEQVMVDFERLSAKPGKAGLPLCAGAMDGTLCRD